MQSFSIFKPQILTLQRPSNISTDGIHEYPFLVQLTQNHFFYSTYLVGILSITFYLTGGIICLPILNYIYYIYTILSSTIIICGFFFKLCKYKSSVFLKR